MNRHDFTTIRFVCPHCGRRSELTAPAAADTCRLDCTGCGRAIGFLGAIKDEIRRVRPEDIVEGVSGRMIATHSEAGWPGERSGSNEHNSGTMRRTGSLI